MDGEAVAVTLARLEGKLDTLAVKVDAGDTAASHLVEIVRTQLADVRTSVDELKKTVSTGHMNLESRTRRLESWVNRLIGGCLLASALGASGLVALVRGWSS